MSSSGLVDKYMAITLMMFDQFRIHYRAITRSENPGELIVLWWT